jgi:mono/diheme cytochrome c family protein
MSFAVGPMSDEDLTAVVSYLRSLPAIKNAVPKDEWGFLAKALAGKFGPRMMEAPRYVPAGEEPDVGRGEYLAKGPAWCAGCHTPVDPLTFKPNGPLLSGSSMAEPDHLDPNFEIVGPNLTPDPETGVLAAFDERAFIDRIRNVGAVSKGTNMPWANFAKMTDSDLKSIYRYLKSLPPTKHVTGPGRRPKGWKPPS